MPKHLNWKKCQVGLMGEKKQESDEGTWKKHDWNKNCTEVVYV